MKNTLFATTALVALGFAGTAFAAEPLTASVGGYMNVGVGFGDIYDGDTASATFGTNTQGDDVGVLRDGEIVVKFKGSSDNGLTFDGRYELEAFGSGDQVDENWARVSGSFGAVMIGGNDTAMYALSAGVLYGPGYVIGYYDAFSRAGQLGKSYGYDGVGIHYYTPNFSGFQAAVSYIPNGDSDGANDGYYKQAAGVDGDNIWSVGANYTAEMEGFRVSASGGYSDADGSDMEAWSLGLELGTAGFTVAAHFEDNAGADAGQDLAVGASYATGPWTATIGYSTLLDAPTGGDIDTFAGWVTYALAPGVKAAAGIEHSSRDGALEDSTAGLAYLNLSF